MDITFENRASTFKAVLKDKSLQFRFEINFITGV